MTAPILLDALVMLPLGLLLQSALFSRRGALLLGLAGSGFLAWIGIKSIQAGNMKLRVSGLVSREHRTPNPNFETPKDSDQEMPPFLKGVFTHLTSPYPYLYWSTVGSAFIRRGFAAGGVRAAALFPLGFWFGAGVFTLLVIYLLAGGKRFLSPHLEPYLHHVSGALLIISAMFLAATVWQGHF